MSNEEQPRPPSLARRRRRRLLRGAPVAVAVAAALGLATASSFGAVSTGHSGWFWGSPQPQGNTLTGLDFAGGIGYASGDFGTLLRTSDNGQSWSGVATDLTAPLAQVRAISASSVVIGGGCALRRSDNGGQSFERLPWTASDQSCPSPIVSFHFPTPRVGYVLTDDGSVLRTEDAGVTFSKGTSLPGTRSVGGYATPTDIFFMSSKVGVATTAQDGQGRVYRTTNGGNSWIEVYSGPGGLQGAFFVDAQDGYTEDAWIGYAVGTNSTVLQTTNGGQTWTRQPLAGIGANLSLSSIDCADGVKCLIAESTGARLIRTTDGGASGSAVSPSTDAIFAGAFASASRVVAVGAQGSTVISDDGGLNFSPIGGEISGAEFGPVTVSQAQIAAAGGANGIVARSFDGGKNWATVGVPTAARVVSPSFPTKSVGYALDSIGGAFKTGNGGASWTILNTGTSAVPRGILAVDPQVVLLVGPEGIRRSTDGGGSFSIVSDKDVKNASLSKLGSISGDDLFVSGPSTMAVSEDGGATWSKLALPYKKFKLKDGDMVTPRSGFVMDSKGRIYKTANGGDKYTELPAIGSAGAYGISFSSPTSGYASTSKFAAGPPAGYAMRTTDGGKTWAPQLVSQEPVSVWDAGATGYANSTGSFFATTSGGQAGTRSTLTLERIGKRSKKTKVGGTLRPPEGGEQIAVSSRPSNGTDWTTKVLTAASNGKFTTKVKSKKRTVVVAQWLGDDERAGTGSTTLTVKPPKKKKGK